MKEPSPPVRSWTVPAGQRAIRLDTFVRRCLSHLSLKEVKKAIEERAFWVNDRPGRKGDRLFGGEVLTLSGSQHLLVPGPLPALDLKVPILFEDRFVLVLDKPAGIKTKKSAKLGMLLILADG